MISEVLMPALYLLLGVTYCVVALTMFLGRH